MNHQQIEFLKNPVCYPDHPKTVKIIQTHISVICLTDEFAYKLKKPVKFKFLDFTTLSSREHFCREELLLNRRLCPQIYLDVIPLYQTQAGLLTFSNDQAGEIIDYAVLMKRLPEELEMNRLLLAEAGSHRHLVTEKDIREVARIIARFHRDSPRNSEVEKAGSPDNQRQAVIDNFLEPYQDGVFDQNLFDAVKEVVTDHLENFVGWLKTRATQGLIVDGHGDLHSGNIFLTDPPTIFDCIEFSPEIRCGDTSVENALLLMDLIYSGRIDLARSYLDEYAKVSGDIHQAEQLPMLISYTAMVRAKVSALLAADKNSSPESREKALISARHHLQLAAAAHLMNRPVAIQVSGLPGGGKSYLCEIFVRRFGWNHFSSDLIRKELAGYPPRVALPDKYYEQDFSQQTYARLQNLTYEAIKSTAFVNTPVLADANFGKRQDRANFSQLPGCEPFIIWITCAENVVKERLGHRLKDPAAVSDAGWTIYEMVQKSFEPPVYDEGVPLLQIDGAKDVDENINQILSWLLKHKSEKIG